MLFVKSANAENITGWLQCSECGFRTTLKSGTVMENSRLSFRTWFLIMLFMTSTKKGLSACESQRQIGYKRYMTIWSIMHILRKVMGNRDGLYQLTDMVEFDEGYFEKEVPQQTKFNLKRVRGSERQINVSVMAESISFEDQEFGKTSNHCRHFKIKVLERYKSMEIKSLIKNFLDPEAAVFSDKSTSYFNIKNYVENHITKKSK